MNSGNSQDPIPPGPILPGARLAPLAALLAASLALTSCGPTAEQVRERASASSSARTQLPGSVPAAPAAPSSSPAAPPSSSAAPLQVGVSGNQAGMPQPVRDACQFLLRRETVPLPAEEGAACIASAMTAGTGGIQTLETSSSWLPQGKHTVRFRTSPDFSMKLANPDLDLDLEISAGGDGAGPGTGTLDTGGGKITADASGTAEQAYAAVLVEAAQLTVNPDRLAGLLRSTGSLGVEYSVALDGVERTKITGHRPAGPASDDMLPTSAVLWLDDYYRPVRMEFTGSVRGVDSSITAVNTGWGAGL